MDFILDSIRFLTSYSNDMELAAKKLLYTCQSFDENRGACDHVQESLKIANAIIDMHKNLKEPKRAMSIFFMGRTR